MSEMTSFRFQAATLRQMRCFIRKFTLHLLSTVLVGNDEEFYAPKLVRQFKLFYLHYLLKPNLHGMQSEEYQLEKFLLSYLRSPFLPWIPAKYE